LVPVAELAQLGRFFATQLPMTLIVITLLRDFHKNNLTNFVGGRIKYTDLRVECKQLSAQRQSRFLTN
jgi:hypothetical protein